MTPEAPGLPAPVPPVPSPARRRLKAVFLSADGRTRSGWTLLVFVLTLWVLGLLNMGALVLLTGTLSRLSELQVQTLQAFLQLTVLFIATWVACWAGRQRLADAYFDPLRLGRRLALGLVGGFALVSASVIAALLADHHAFALTARPAGEVARSMGLQLLLLVPAATGEELALRGLVLQQLGRAGAGVTGALLTLFKVEEDRRERLGRGAGVVFALLVTSVLFGLAHLGNPNVSPWAIANIILVGLVFGVITLRQGSLWAAVGLHIGWNVFLGVFWGLPISGFDFGLSVLEPTRVGEEVWTGGSFGPEASAVTTAVLGAALIAMLLLPFRKPAARLVR